MSKIQTIAIFFTLMWVTVSGQSDEQLLQNLIITDKERGDLNRCIENSNKIVSLGVEYKDLEKTPLIACRP